MFRKTEKLCLPHINYNFKVINKEAYANAEQLSQIGQSNGMTGCNSPGQANVILFQKGI